MISTQPSHSAFYACVKRSSKWYQKVVFELILGTAIVNRYLLHRENCTTSTVTILQFRESFVHSFLLLEMSFEKSRERQIRKNVVAITLICVVNSASINFNQ